MCLETINNTAHLPEAMIAFKVVRTFTERGENRYGSAIIDVLVDYDPWFTGARRYDKMTVPLGCGWGYNGESRTVAGRKVVSDTVEHLPLPKSYSAGVHAYVYSEDAFAAKEEMTDGWPWAANLSVVRVLLRGPLCCGKERRKDVVVYREMSILEEIGQPPPQEALSVEENCHD